MCKHCYANHIASKVRSEAAPDSFYIGSTRGMTSLDLHTSARWGAGTTSTTVSYTFATNALSQSNPGATGISLMNADQKKGMIAAMAQFSNVANVKFEEAANASTANIKFAQGDLPTGIAAWAYYPNSGGSDLVVDIAYQSGFTPGTFGYALALHELGHALGLSHPGGNGYNSLYNNDSTVMSYNSGRFAGLGSPYPPASLMVLDIKELQEVYGANKNYNSGNTNYALSGAARAQTIWDGAGVDTLNASSFKSGGAQLDLREGTDYISLVGNTRNFIAYGANIENAIGTGFNDAIYGNALANKINGGGGTDFITGNEGDDFIYGETGNDLLYGGSGNDLIVGGDGKDTLIGETGNDILQGGGGGDYLIGGSENDVFKFISLSDSSGSNYDIISGFVKGQDKIDLDPLSYTSIASGIAVGSVLGYQFSGSLTVITSADKKFTLILDSKVELTNSDFVF